MHGFHSDAITGTVHADSVGKLTEASKCNRAIVNVISYACASAATIMKGLHAT